MRNTSGLPNNNQYKPYSEKEQALEHTNRRLLKIARFAAQLNESELGKGATNTLITEIAAQISDIGADLAAWSALADN